MGLTYSTQLTEEIQLGRSAKSSSVCQLRYGQGLIVGYLSFKKTWFPIIDLYLKTQPCHLQSLRLTLALILLFTYLGDIQCNFTLWYVQFSCLSIHQAVELFKLRPSLNHKRGNKVPEWHTTSKNKQRNCMKLQH